MLDMAHLLSRRTLARVVLFDGRCGLCLGSRRWAEKLDWYGAVNWVNFRDPEVRAAVPQLTDAQLENEMWVVRADGRAMSGFAAWRDLLKGLPLMFLPALLLYVPPIPFIGKRVYRYIAARRRLTCEIQPQMPVASGQWRGILQRAQL